MVSCGFCGREQSEAGSCTKNAIVTPDGDMEGYWAAAVPYGNEDAWDADGRCHSCGVAPGGFHHPGCDVEEDPVNGGQLLKRVLTTNDDHSPMHARVQSDPHNGIEEARRVGGDE